MSEQIKPDLKFINSVINAGGESLKKCFQCATCSVVCKVTPDDKPFPRKEMVQAQWGLKDKLLSNPDIWLCHQCSDCTAYCPRGAKPGEVLGAIRKLSIEHYAFPSFVGKAVADPKFLLLTFAVPVLIFGAVLMALGNLKIPDGEIVYAEKFMPVPVIDAVFIMSAIFAMIGFGVGITRYWKDLTSGTKVKGLPMAAIMATVTEFLAHKKFKTCEETVDRSRSHLFTFYGFVGLAITTTWAIVYLYGMQWLSPYPLRDPMKIFGNLSAASLLIGITLVIINRLKHAEKAGSGSYFDWLFIGVIFTIVTTGLLSEILRLLHVPVLAYPVYFIHLVVVFFLFAYAPFSKMAHMVYRTTALVYAKHTGRDKA
ncbi:MAG: heterodisulfide reductase [Thermodesulfovibrio sp.]|nr:heterodisulfide reductase [Thermodesulfovibrio sp.]